MKIQFNRVMVPALLALLLLPLGSAWAQDSDRDGDRYRDRIDQDSSLNEAQRDRMQTRLQDCKDLAVSGDQLDALFPEGGSQYSAESRLRMQERVLELAREGQPVDLLCEKIGEGEMKRAREQDVEKAVQRMGEYVGEAHRYMEQAKGDGVSGLDNAADERHLQRGLTMNMWRGLEEGELAQLRTQARERLRDGSCNLTDLSAAAETATELKEMGVGSDRAMSLCGEALRQGYPAEDIRGLGHMVMAAHMNGESGDEMCDQLQDRVRDHEGFGDMQQHMIQNGWMGPESMGHGYGGGSPVDDVMGGGHHGGAHEGGGMGGDEGGGMGGHN
jgi:hypothetical protein